MSCVAQRKTRANHHHVKVHTLLSDSPASVINWLMFLPSQIIENPEMVWMGKIQLFLRPTFGDHIASTIGLQRSFSEYGYAASEKTPMAEYETTFLSRNGTEPCARPMGMPWRKYSNTRSRKLLWSFFDSSKKPFDGPSSSSSGGISSSSVKDELLMRLAAWLEGEVPSILACLRRCSRMTPFIVALVFACPLVFSFRSESVELLRGTEPRFLDLEARLLICGKRACPSRGVLGILRGLE